MKKLAVLVVLSIPLCGIATTLSGKLDRTLTNAFTRMTVRVKVTLAKPVYMSDVMFRPVRGKDVVIRTDYKEQTCTGLLSTQEMHVYVPLSCVQDANYKAEKINLTFADGRSVKKSAQALHLHENSAHIVL